MAVNHVGKTSNGKMVGIIAGAVVLLLALIGGIAFFTKIDPARQAALRNQSTNNLKQLALGVEMFVNENSKYPTAMDDLNAIVGDPLICPISKKPYILVNDLGKLDRSKIESLNPSQTILLHSEPISSDGQRIVAYLDGRAEVITDEVFKKQREDFDSAMLNTDKMEQLKRLAELKESKVLTEEEFVHEKSKILG